MTTYLKGFALAFVLLFTGTQAHAQRDEAADRAAIHNLQMAYGSTLDTRDFDGFTALWTEDGDYNGTPGPETGEMMRKVFADNPSGAREPNFHLFFNEVITFDGPDRANVTSMSYWVAPDEQGRPVPLMLGQYEDVVVRVGEEWKFQSRKVKLPMASARPAAAAAE